MPGMGANIALSMVNLFVIVLTNGYITHVVCPSGDETTTLMKVFRIAGTIGGLNYASSGVSPRIWFKARSWAGILDRVVYGVVLDGVSGSMWLV